MLRGLDSIRGRLVLAFLVAALVPVVVNTVLTRVQTTSALSRAERAEAARALQSVHALFERIAADDTAILANHVPRRVMASFPTPDRVRDLQRDLIRATARADRSDVFVQLITGGGYSMVSGSLLHADTLSTLGLVPGEIVRAPVARVSTILGEPYVISAATLRSQSRQRALATVLVARPLDDQTLATIAALTGTRVALFVDGVLVSASHRDGFDGLDEFLVSGPEDGEIAVEGSWTTGYAALGDSGRTLLRVAVPRAPFAAASSSLSSTGWWLLALAIGVAVATALAVWRTFGRRLRALGVAARAITRDERPPRLDIRGNDDIAAVARSFNDMSTAVQTRFGDLTGKLDALTVSLGDLNLVGETLASSPDVRRELSRVADMLRDMTASDVVAFHLERSGTLVREVCAGDPGDSDRALDRLGEIAAATMTATYSEELSEDERFMLEMPSSPAGLRSAKTLPLIHQRRVLGAITIASREPRRYQGRSATVLATVASQTALALSQARTYHELERSYLETVSALLAALEAMDAYTADHGGSLIDLVLAVGEELGLEADELRRVRFAAALHDIGKIGVPASILRKPGPLTAEERDVMERHTEIGERIVARIHYLEPISRIIRSAHERWDGQGYPDGLRGVEIPLEARIVFVCDAYHAMTSDRPYRAAVDPQTALRELRRTAGTQFDPTVVEAFALALGHVTVVDAPYSRAADADPLALELARLVDG